MWQDKGKLRKIIINHDTEESNVTFATKNIVSLYKAGKQWQLKSQEEEEEEHEQFLLAAVQEPKTAKGKRKS